MLSWPCACVETVFPNTIWNGLLAVDVFPKYIYVKAVDSISSIFTMSKICCVVTRLAEILLSFCIGGLEPRY